jgi:tetratricopeptide (TPR) repeat protein
MNWRPITRRPAEKGAFVVIHWQRLLVAVIIGLTASWVLSTFSAFLFIKYFRGFTEVRYPELFWPNRWAEYRVNEGNYYITHANELLLQSEAVSALQYLRSGVAKAPANAAGRTTLAGLYLAFRRPDLARETLLDGLSYLSADPSYCETTLSFLLSVQEDDKLLEAANAILGASATANALCRPIAATYAATAAFNRGNFDLTEDLLTQHHLRESQDGTILQARIEWERGYPELALLQLREHLSRHPSHDSARALLASYYRTLNRPDEWESTIVERLVNAPLAAAPRIEYLYLHHQRGDTIRLERESGAYLDAFHRDTPALLLLADFAANTGHPALARQVQQILAGRNENSGPAALMVAEACLAAGDYPGALTLIGGYTRQYPEWTTQFAPVFSGLQCVALYGLDKKDEARLSLDRLLGQKNLRADNLLAVANRLTALGAHDLAIATLRRAIETDPLNQPALAHLIRLETDQGAMATLPGHLERYLRTRKPSREILAHAYEVIGRDRYLFLPGQNDLLASLRLALAPRRS